MIRRRYLLPLVTVGVLYAAGADCGRTLSLADVADCCTCLADTSIDGADAGGFDPNCLPDDPETTRGIASAEENACAAGAGEAVNGNGRILVEPGCLQAPHPCAEICGDANRDGAVFIGVDVGT